MYYPQYLKIGHVELSLYNLGMYLALVVAMIYNIWAAKKYKIPVWKVIIMTIFWDAFCWGAAVALSKLEWTLTNGAIGPYETNGVRAWIYVPFYHLFMGWIMKEKKAKVMDMMAPCLPLGDAIGHFGCQFAGCCHGYAYDGFLKIWNPQLNQFVFPIQLIECIAAFLIFLGLLIYSKKTKFQTTGKQYAFWLIAFGITRFIFEFFRDNTKILWGCSSLSFHAIKSAVVGIVWLLMLTPKGRILWIKIKNFFRNIVKKPALFIPNVEEMKEIIKKEREESIPTN